MAHVRDWAIELIQTHSKLFHPPEGHPEQAAGYPRCESGWRDLLERLCSRIEAALGEQKTIRIVQVKEKFASLRCYWRGDVSAETAARVHEAVALAEARSGCTCEHCGAQGKLYANDAVYKTRCTSHSQGVHVPSGPGLENVHLVRLPTPDGYRLAARRYDRETDITFIDGVQGDTR